MTSLSQNRRTGFLAHLPGVKAHLEGGRISKTASRGESGLAGRSQVRILMLAAAAISWITLNVFFLPFVVWSAGIVRPWYMLKGLLPYRDFVWIRTPFDLALLSGWYSIFGATPFSYQLFVYTLLLLSTVVVFLIIRILGIKGYVPFLTYLLFLFPLFLNTEEGELLIGLLALGAFATTLKFFSSRNNLWLFASGLLASLLFLTKQNTIFVAVAILTAVIIDIRSTKVTPKQVRRILEYFVPGGLVPVVSVIIFFAYQGALPDLLYHTVYLVLGPYRTAYVTRGDGLNLALAYLAVLVPFVLFWRKTTLSKQSVLLLGLFSISLLPSLLPSFLSYRAYPGFPFVAIMLAILISLLGKKRKSLSWMHQAVSLFSVVLFIFLITGYLRSYVRFVWDNGLSLQQYIQDYGVTEREIADWISRNTRKDERIMNYASEMVYLMASRLPANKHVDPFPYLLRPFERSMVDFTRQPPRIVVWDKTLPQAHPGLSDWPFLKILETDYNQVEKFGESLIIYEYSKNNQ